MNLLVGGVQAVAAGCVVEPVIPSPQRRRERQSVRIGNGQTVRHRQPQLFQLDSGERPPIGRDGQFEHCGQAHTGALVVEMAHAEDVFGIEPAHGISHGIVGHVGREMTPGNVAVAPQVLEHMAAVTAPFAHDFAVALGTGPQHHHLAVGLWQRRVVGHRVEELLVVDPGPGLAAGTVGVLHPDGHAGDRVLFETTAGLGQSREVGRIGGGDGHGQLQGARQMGDEGCRLLVAQLPAHQALTQILGQGGIRPGRDSDAAQVGCRAIGPPLANVSGAFEWKRIGNFVNGIRGRLLHIGGRKVGRIEMGVPLFRVTQNRKIVAGAQINGREPGLMQPEDEPALGRHAGPEVNHGPPPYSL